MKKMAKFYERYQKIDAGYEEAREARDEDGMEACREAYQELRKEVQEEGEGVASMMQLYSEMMKHGNSRIDINDACQEPEKVISIFRDFGVTEFTFSSTWTNATETAWAFTKLGCSLKGMTEINDGDEKIPAFLFTL